MWTAINILFVITFFSCLFWVLRYKYHRDIQPSKKFPQGRMIAEFWQETGQRPKKLVPIKANGMEIEAPTEHSKGSRYFFTKSAIGRTKYPTQPLFPFSWLQVDVDICSWVENCPIPINPKVITKSVRGIMLAVCPKCQHEIKPGDIIKHCAVGKSDIYVICPECKTREVLAQWLDHVGFNEETNLEIENIMTAEGFAMIQDTDQLALGQAVNEEGAQELAIARANRLNKQHIYILLIVCALAAIGAAVFAYQAYTTIASLSTGA